MILNGKFVNRSIIPSGVLVGSLLVLAPCGLRAQALEACGPSPAVKVALDQLRAYPPPHQPWAEFRDQKLAKLQALLRQFPDDLFVERSYIEFKWDAPDRDKLIEQYRVPAEKSPDNPRVLYLYGYALYGRRTPETIKLLESAIERAPQFAWPHFTLAGIYASRNFSNKEKAVSHLKSFLGSCPSAFEGYELLERLDNKDFVRESAQKLRALISARSDPDAVGAYSALWSLEFKVRPPSEYDSLRKQVALDLKRIRSLNLQDGEKWYEALEEGYKLVNDQTQSDWAKEERQRRFPRPWELAAAEKWQKDHPEPKSGDPPEKRKEYYAAVLKATDEFIKQRPNTLWLWWGRLNAMEHLDDVPAAEVEATADAAVKAAEANAEPSGVDSGFLFEAAGLLSKKKLQPQRELELAQQGLKQWEIESKIPPWDTWMDEKISSDRKFYRTSDAVRGLTLEGDATLQLGQVEKAQLKLAQIDERLQELKSLAGDKAERQKAYSTREAAYGGLMARLAQAQNHKVDAMALYEDALLTRLRAGEIPEAGDKDELADNARTLWNELGGTEEGWKNWYAKRVAAEAAKSHLTWEKANEPLPSFEIADIQGKTWKMADLKGKVVLLNVWASW
jgi:hypothetical protein